MKQIEFIVLASARYDINKGDVVKASTPGAAARKLYAGHVWVWEMYPDETEKPYRIFTIYSASDHSGIPNVIGGLGCAREDLPKGWGKRTENRIGKKELDAAAERRLRMLKER